ncbi:hypothetical protein AAE478_003954 [Parahypoxylon ruwenzoriense]
MLLSEYTRDDRKVRINKHIGREIGLTGFIVTVTVTVSLPEPDTAVIGLDENTLLFGLPVMVLVAPDCVTVNVPTFVFENVNALAPELGLISIARVPVRVSVVATPFEVLVITVVYVVVAITTEPFRALVPVIVEANVPGAVASVIVGVIVLSNRFVNVLVTVDVYVLVPDPSGPVRVLVLVFVIVEMNADPRLVGVVAEFGIKVTPLVVKVEVNVDPKRVNVFVTVVV